MFLIKMLIFMPLFCICYGTSGGPQGEVYKLFDSNMPVGFQFKNTLVVRVDKKGQAIGKVNPRWKIVQVGQSRIAELTRRMREHHKKMKQTVHEGKGEGKDTRHEDVATAEITEDDVIKQEITRMQKMYSAFRIGFIPDEIESSNFFSLKSFAKMILPSSSKAKRETRAAGAFGEITPQQIRMKALHRSSPKSVKVLNVVTESNVDLQKSASRNERAGPGTSMKSPTTLGSPVNPLGIVVASPDGKVSMTDSQLFNDPNFFENGPEALASPQTMFAPHGTILATNIGRTTSKEEKTRAHCDVTDSMLFNDPNLFK